MKRFFASRGTRYLAVGLINTVFGFGIFAGLELTAGRVLPYIVVLMVAHIIAVLESFLLQRRLVFRSREPWVPELVRFWSVNLFILALNVVLLVLAVEIAKAPVLLAQFSIFLLLSAASYVLHRSFSFSSRSLEGPSSPATMRQAHTPAPPKSSTSVQ